VEPADVVKAGEPGVAVAVATDELLETPAARVADVTEPDAPAP
jgi:hypothetical protein